MRCGVICFVELVPGGFRAIETELKRQAGMVATRAEAGDVIKRQRMWLTGNALEDLES